MQTKASIASHPVHTMLVPLPIGLFTGALVFDLLHVGTGQPGWGLVAFWVIAAGLVGALLAAVPGLIDYSGLRGPARRIATWHLAMNLTLVGLFALNLWLRTGPGQAPIGPGLGIPLALTIVGVALMFASGWLGGEMVYRHRVGVEEAGGRDLRRVGRRAA
jgi:uncharacterized membrane protein